MALEVRTSGLYNQWNLKMDKEKTTIFEAFSGYGTASFALNRLRIVRELVGYSDIDKYANQCFKQNHCPWDTDDKLQLGDATKIDPNKLKDFNLLTGGFPCQAFSIAGKGLGELDTRGTLFNEIIRIAEVKKPRYMMLENVKGLMSKTHKPTFDKIISELYRIGYFVKWKVLNTKDYGIPQNRERVFFTCFRDWNDFCRFEFPLKEELKIFLKDILEDEVDEKYYLKQHTVDRLLNNGQGFRSKINPEVGSCLFASMHKVSRGMDMVQEPFMIDNRYQGEPRIYEEVSPTLTSHGNSKGGIPIPFIAASRGRNIENPSDRTTGNLTEQRLESKIDGTSNTISTVQKDNYVCEAKLMQLNNPKHSTNRIYSPNGIGRCLRGSAGGLGAKTGAYLMPDMRIRKLTPKECFRLQGFLDDEINLEGLSDTQRYKLAGNGQTVTVVEKILKNMLGVKNE